MPSPYPSDLTPQQKAARVSAENRRERAAERKRKVERPAHLAAEHGRGEHDGFVHLGCPRCAQPPRCNCIQYVERGVGYHAPNCPAAASTPKAD